MIPAAIVGVVIIWIACALIIGRVVGRWLRGVAAATPTPVFDTCFWCHGVRGGVPGNGNVVSGLTFCDYCHADMMAGSITKLAHLCDHEVGRPCAACMETERRVSDLPAEGFGAHAVPGGLT